MTVRAHAAVTTCALALLLATPMRLAGQDSFAAARQLYASAEYRGRARLQSGATGLQRTNYYWQGSSGNNSSEETFTGPLYGYWDTSDVAPVLVYTPCGEQKVLNINTELRVDAGGAATRSSMSMRSSDGDVDTLFNFNWQRC